MKDKLWDINFKAFHLNSPHSTPTLFGSYGKVKGRRYKERKENRK